MSAPGGFCKKAAASDMQLAAASFHGFSGRRYAHAARKKLIATANRCEGVYNRTGEPSVTFCEKEEQGSGRTAYFCKKNKPEQSGLCSDVVGHQGLEPRTDRL